MSENNVEVPDVEVPDEDPVEAATVALITKRARELSAELRRPDAEEAGVPVIILAAVGARVFARAEGHHQQIQAMSDFLVRRLRIAALEEELEALRSM